MKRYGAMQNKKSIKVKWEIIPYNSIIELNSDEYDLDDMVMIEEMCYEEAYRNLTIEFKVIK